MKILIIQDYLRCGGTERQSVHLAHQLRTLRNEVSLLTFRPGGRLATDLARTGVEHTSLQAFDTGLNFFAPWLSRTIRETRPDVVLCMGRMANCYAGFIQIRFPEVAVIGTVRTGKALPALNLWSLRRVSGVLTNAEWWHTRLVHQGLDPHKIAVVPNGLTFDWSGVDPASLRSEFRGELGISPSTVVLLNVAGFRIGKRQAHLIELFSTLDLNWDSELWFIGDGTRRKHCHRIVDRLKLRRVRMFGHSAAPLPWYAAADIAVSASVEDSSPNFLVEAQTMGLPVVATDYRGVGETIIAGETGFLIAPHDREGFRAALSDLYHRPELRQNMGHRAASFAADRFSGEAQAVKLLEALRTFYLRSRGVAENFA